MWNSSKVIKNYERINVNPGSGLKTNAGSKSKSKQSHLTQLKAVLLMARDGGGKAPAVRNRQEG